MEIEKLQPILDKLEAVQMKLIVLEGNITSRNVENLDEQTIIQSCSDPDGFEISHERFLSNYATNALKEGRQFEEDMKDRAQTVYGSAYGSEVASQPGRIRKWIDNLDEEATVQLDEAIDVQSPTQSQRSQRTSLPSQEVGEETSVRFEQEPDFISEKVKFFQEEVNRLEGAGAFADARKCQIKSIELLKDLEERHDMIFEERVTYMKRLAHLHIQDNTVENFEQAASIVKEVQKDAGEDMEMTSALHQMLAVAYMGKDDMKQAMRHATIALDIRHKLPGISDALVGESAEFLIEYYEAQDDIDARANAQALRKTFGRCLSNKKPRTSNNRSRQPVRKFSSLSDPVNGAHTEVNWLREQGFDIKPHDWRDRLHPATSFTPMIALVMYDWPIGQEKVALDHLRRLVDGGADVNATDGIEELQMTPVMWAAKKKNKLALDLLLRSGADPRLRDAKGRTAMHISVQGDSTTIAEALYKQDDELIQMPDYLLTTPLYSAVELRLAKMVRFLLNRGAELSRQNSDGKTPLHAAVEQQSGELLESLIQAYHKVDLDKQDHNGRTPLIYAVEQKITDSVKILLRHKANVDRQDADGRTALHIAVYNDAVDLANIILNHSPAPDLTLVNKEDHNIIDLVKNKGKNSRMYDLFKRRGCLSSPHLGRSSTTLAMPISPSRVSSATDRTPSLGIPPQRSHTISTPAEPKKKGLRFLRKIT